VINGGIVLIDRLLYESHPESAGIELDVRRSIAGDATDVVDSLELHPFLSFGCVRLASPGSRE
jgi:hypothetical protein